jgi:hypothetical protein
VELKGLTNVLALGAGDSHTCALDDEGAIYCWGSNEDGQLGGSDLVHGVAAHESAQLTSHSAVSAEGSVRDELQAARDLTVSAPETQPSRAAPATHVDASAERVTASTDQLWASGGHVGVSAVEAEKREPPVELATPTKVLANHDAIDSPNVASTRAPRSTPEPEMAAPLALAPNSDLVMVETRFAPPLAEAETDVAPRPRRERRSSAAVPDEPLQMVETRKDQPSA